jgi:glyoxylase-like metal-dependent hydrolase (beta-lactamase superfamily II)
MIIYPHETPPAAGESILVAPGIHWIRMPLPFALDHINLWLLEDNDEHGETWTIVDTGYGVAATHELWEQHFAKVMSGKPVKRIIVTHYHPDHVGCAAWLHAKTGAPVWMTTSEYLSAHAAAEDFAGFDRENSARLFIAHGLAKMRPDFVAAQKARTGAYKRGVPTVPKQYYRIMEGDEIVIGARTWRVITAFGHAPEHATLFSAEDSILISGDQVLPRITTNVGVWGNQPEANPLKQFLDSMDKFEPLPPNTLVLPSHDRVFSGLHERLAELRQHHQQRLGELEAAIETAKCAAEILPVLFRRKLDEHQLVFAIGEAIAHLHYLWRAGRATRHLGEDGVYTFERLSLQG